MEGCVAKSVKFILFLTNFLVFVLGLVTLGFGIWVIVDKPSFLNLFSDAQEILDNNQISTDGFDLQIYAGAPILLIVVAVIISVIAFFGCFGAIKENKCLLITYFIIVLGILIAFVVGAILVYQGKFESEVKDPLVQSMDYYKDTPESETDKAYKEIWNTVQKELRCCGVNNYTDWSKHDIDWEGTFLRPEGCCMHSRDHDEENDESQIKVCRADDGIGLKTKYYFEGCYTVIINEIENHQDKIFGAAIATVVIMFLNLLFAFAMCTMAD